MRLHPRHRPYQAFTGTVLVLGILFIFVGAYSSWWAHQEISVYEDAVGSWAYSLNEAEQEHYRNLNALRWGGLFTAIVGALIVLSDILR